MRQVPWLMTARMNSSSREQTQELFVRRTRSDQAQTGTWHVIHLILVTLLLVPHRMLHRGTGCLLLFKDMIKGYRAQPATVPFSGACFTCESFSHFRKNCPHIALEQPSTSTVSKWRYWVGKELNVKDGLTASKNCRNFEDAHNTADNLSNAKPTIQQRHPGD